MADPAWERGNERDRGYYVAEDGTLRNSAYPEPAMQSPTKKFAQKKHLASSSSGTEGLAHQGSCEHLHAAIPATQAPIAALKPNVRELPDGNLVE